MSTRWRFPFLLLFIISISIETLPNVKTVSECVKCLTNNQEFGWCGSINEGKCLLGGESGPINATCNEEWNFYLCPPSSEVQFNVISDVYVNSVPSSCFITNNCSTTQNAYLLTAKIPMNMLFLAELDAGALIMEGHLLMKASFCWSENHTGPIKLSYEIENESPSYKLWISPSNSSCNSMNTIYQEIILPMPISNPWWTQWIYQSNAHNMKMSINDDSVAISISLLQLVVRFQMVDPSVRTLSPILIPYCVNAHDISVYALNYGKLSYTCLFRSDNGNTSVVATYVSSVIFQCHIPFDSKAIPQPAEGEPASVNFILVPDTGTDVSITSWIILFYTEPLQELLYPSTGTIRGKDEISIWGSGFFDAPNITLYLGNLATGNIIAINSGLLVEPPAQIQFLSPTVERSGLYWVKVSMNGIDLPERGLNFTYVNDTGLVPILPAFPKADPCHNCLLNASLMGWCGETNDEGFCGAASGDGSSIQPCNITLWNYFSCPDETLTIPLTLIKEVIIAGFGHNFCKDSCVLNRNFTLINENIYKLNQVIPNGHIIHSATLSSRTAICIEDGTVTLAFSVDDMDPIFHVFNESSSCPSGGQLQIYDIMIPMPGNPWWDDFDYNGANHTFNILKSAHGGKDQQVAAVKLEITFQVQNIDPMLAAPYVFPDLLDYCINCTHHLKIYGTNFLRFQYACQLTIKKGTEDVTFQAAAWMLDASTATCDIQFTQDLEPYIPDFGKLLPINFQFFPLTGASLTFPTTPIYLFRAPLIDSLKPSVGSSGTLVMIIGNGFFKDNRLQATVWVEDVPYSNPDITVFDIKTIAFHTPHRDPGTVVCIRVSMNNVLKSECHNFSYLSLPPSPIPSPAPLPSPVPLPAPFQPSTSDGFLYFLYHYWYLLMIILIVVLLVVVITVVMSCRFSSHTDGYIMVDSEDFAKTAIEKTEIKPSDITLKNVVGVGSFATVYCGFWNKTQVAVKVIRDRNRGSTQVHSVRTQLLEEAMIMVNLRHPNIVAFLGACLSKEPDLFIVTEFMSRGSVNDILHDKKIELEPMHIQHMALDCCKGMAYLHSVNIIHRDLKTPNLLVDRDWRVKVSDFGLSRVTEDAQLSQNLTACGTPSWAAPEVLRELKYSSKADVYSFGICLWEMCTREEPYADLHAPQVVIFVAVKGKRLSIPHTVHEGMAGLIRKSWHEEPASRPTFISLVESLEALVLPEAQHPNPFLISDD